MMLVVRRSVIAGDGSIVSAADLGRTGAAAVALSVRLPQRLPIPQPLRRVHWICIVDGSGLHPTVLSQSVEREECYVSMVLVSLLHRCSTAKCLADGIVLPLLL